MNTPNTRKRVRDEVDEPVSHSYALRSTPPKRMRKAPTVINITIPEVKKKLVLSGKGIPLKEIPSTVKMIRAANKEGKFYHLSLLHNLMYGFSGKGRERVKNIIKFSGYPKGITREAKLRQLNSNSLYSWRKCYYLKLFLTWFGRSTDGNKEEIFHRFLDFMFHPEP